MEIVKTTNLIKNPVKTFSENTEIKFVVNKDVIIWGIIPQNIIDWMLNNNYLTKIKNDYENFMNNWEVSHDFNFSNQAKNSSLDFISSDRKQMTNEEVEKAFE